MLVLVALFIVVPLVEIAVIIQVGQWLGVLDTIALLLLISVIGAWLVKHQGLGALRRLADDWVNRRLPGETLADGALILVAGVLLVTPGFVTDAVGLLLLVPPFRKAVRAALRHRFARRVEIRRLG